VARDAAGAVGGAGPTGTLELRGASSRAPLVVPERETVRVEMDELKAV